MKVFTVSKNVEVIGESLQVMVDGMGAFRGAALQLLGNYGIHNIEKGKWYNDQAFLNAFKEISEKIGPNTLKVIGRTVPEKALLPPTIKDIDTALIAIDQAFHMNHRGGEIGHYSFKKTGPRNGIMRCDNAYPCTFDQGLLLGFMVKVKKAGENPVVKHVKGPCRMEGGEYCEYDVMW
jgi:hypothetical protein